MKDYWIELKDIYREQYAHFRAMNEILYKIPPLFSVVLGGLWFFAISQLHNKPISIAIFLFSASLSVLFINIMGRFGAAFNAYIDNLNKFDGDFRVTIKPSKLPSTVQTIKYVLWMSAVVSILGAVYGCTL